MKNIKLGWNKESIVFNYGMSEELFDLNELDCVFRRGSDIFFADETGNTDLMPTIEVEVVKGYFKELCKVLLSTDRFVMCGDDTIFNTEKLLDYSVAQNRKIITLCFNSCNVTCQFTSTESLNSAIKDVERVLQNNLTNSK